MSTAQLNVLLTSLFFLSIFLFGYCLNRSGKPYRTLPITLHKLIALAAAMYLVINLISMYRAAPFSTLEIAAALLAAVCFAGTAATGVMLSFDKTWPEIVPALHQVTPYLALFSTAALLYLLV